MLPSDPFVRIFCFLGLSFFRDLSSSTARSAHDVGGCDAQRSAEAVQKGTPGTDVELGRGIYEGSLRIFKVFLTKIMTRKACRHGLLFLIQSFQGMTLIQRRTSKPTHFSCRGVSFHICVSNRFVTIRYLIPTNLPSLGDLQPSFAPGLSFAAIDTSQCWMLSRRTPVLGAFQVRQW